MAHYRHAREKHPYFANWIGPSGVAPHWIAANMLDIARDTLTREISAGSVDALTVLKCEVAEIGCACANGDYDGAIEECYDAIAVLMRMIDVLEGRQALGKPVPINEYQAQEWGLEKPIYDGAKEERK